MPPSAKLAGLPIAGRVVHAAVRAGYSGVVVWALRRPSTPLARLLLRLAHQTGTTVEVATVQHEWDAAIALRPADSVTIIGAGTVVSPSVLARAREISAEAGQCIDVAAGPKWPQSGVAFSLLYALPGIVVLAAIGANVYWMSLVMKMPHLLGRSEAVRQPGNNAALNRLLLHY